MAKSIFPNSIRRFIRTQKAAIRTRISDEKEAEQAIALLMAKLRSEYQKKPRTQGPQEPSPV